MIVTGKMRHLSAAVLDSDSRKLTRALLELGVLDLVSFDEAGNAWQKELDPVRPSEEERNAGKLRERIDTFFQITGTHPGAKDSPEGEQGSEALDYDEVSRRLDRIAADIQKVRDKQKMIHKQIQQVRELKSGAGGSGAQQNPDYRYLRIRYGSVPEDVEDNFRASLAQYPSLFLEGGVLMNLKRDDAAIGALLEQFSWRDSAPRPVSNQIKPEEKKALDAKIREYEQKNRELEEKAREVVSSRHGELEELWFRLRVNELASRMKTCYGKTSRTVVLTGWIPEKRQAETETLIKKICGKRCHIEWRDPLTAQKGTVPKSVPVVMNNPSWLRPFEKLVTNFAVPAYGTIDPTLFVALFYCVMFGLMFGDVGHGIVVLLTGIIGGLRSRRSGGKEHFLFPLFRFCGASAMLSGLLFGSWFGMPLLPPLWFDYHGVVSGHVMAGSVKSISDILLITIYFGIIVIALSLLLNWYNRIVKRDYLSLFFDKGGILGGWLYGAGTWTAFFFVEHSYRELPSGDLLMMILGIPALLMLVKPIIEWRREHPSRFPGPMDLVNLLMEWIVELLEVFSGYLSNTLSFMRVAGLGIAHVSLMIAFFQIADMAAGPGGFGFWSYLILLLGNMLVIGLEGLSAGIQSLRLNYYEFFSRYFDGTGRIYAPVSLKQDM